DWRTEYERSEPRVRQNTLYDADHRGRELVRSLTGARFDRKRYEGRERRTLALALEAIERFTDSGDIEPAQLLGARSAVENVANRATWPGAQEQVARWDLAWRHLVHRGVEDPSVEVRRSIQTLIAAWRSRDFQSYEPRGIRRVRSLSQRVARS